MGAKIECFFLEPTDRAQVSFRRYASGSDCPKGYYHNVSVVVDHDIPYVEDNNGRGDIPSDVQKQDARWPAKCDCGYEFKDDDEWQIVTRRFYQRTTGDRARFTLAYGGLGKAPDGSMWFADWMSARGPDDHCLIVRTPGGDWPVDGKASNSDSGWTRTGTLPKITVSPSIGMGEKGSGRYFHAFLRNGFLEPCGDSEC